MKKLFKSKLVLSLLASSFVLATGCVGFSKVKSSFAMQNKTEFETDQNKKNLYNFLKAKAYYAVYGRTLADDGFSYDDIHIEVTFGKDRTVYFYKKGDTNYFNCIKNFDAYKNTNRVFKYNSYNPNNRSLFEIDNVAAGMKRLNQEEEEAGGENKVITFENSSFTIPLGTLNCYTRMIYEHLRNRSFAVSGLRYSDIPYCVRNGRLYVNMDGFCDSYYPVDEYLKEISEQHYEDCD